MVQPSTILLGYILQICAFVFCILSHKYFSQKSGVSFKSRLDNVIAFYEMLIERYSIRRWNDSYLINLLKQPTLQQIFPENSIKS